METGTEIEIVCPSCRKAGTVPIPPPDDLACPRCRCELATLAAIRHSAANLLRSASDSLRRGDPAEALTAATTAWELHQTRAAASLAFIAATLDKDPIEGAAWLRTSRRPGLA